MCGHLVSAVGVVGNQLSDIPNTKYILEEKLICRRNIMDDERVVQTLGERMTVALRTREVYLFGAIDDSEGNISEICSVISYLDSISADPIYLYVNSPGGDPSAALALVDFIHAITDDGSEVYVIGAGEVMSAAAFLLALSPRGNRYVTPHAMLMFHGVSWSLGEDTTDQHDAWNRAMKAYGLRLRIELAGAAKEMTPRKMNTKLKNTWILTAQMAVEAGVADGIWRRKFQDGPEKTD